MPAHSTGSLVQPISVLSGGAEGGFLIGGRRWVADTLATLAALDQDQTARTHQRGRADARFGQSFAAGWLLRLSGALVGLSRSGRTTVDGCASGWRHQRNAKRRRRGEEDGERDGGGGARDMERRGAI